MKFNSSGILLWDNIRDEVGKQVLNYIDLDASDNLFLVYKTEHDEEETWYFLKYDHSGNQLWIRENEEIGSLKYPKIKIDQDDYIILRGDELYFKIFKYNTSGYQIWNKTIISYGYCFEHADNYYFSTINYTSLKGYVIKYNSTLEQIWSSNYQMGNYIGGLLIDNDQNVYVIADINIPSERSEDIFITKLNASGSFLYNLTWGGPRWDDVRASGFDSKNNLYMIIRCYYTSGYKWYFVKNPIDNNKSLEPVIGLNFYEMYLIMFLTIAGVISIFSLKTIIKPRLKNRLNS